MKFKQRILCLLELYEPVSHKQTYLDDYADDINCINMNCINMGNIQDNTLQGDYAQVLPPTPFCA
ncbi:hypothetical protein HYU21_03430 [Candidatus Woesearchaeota archaeon]|nr:hypothetical protein [Candidatus Woesearchaeota archaeon]